MSLPIGEVSARSGLSVDTLRYYEREGIVPIPERNAGGQRRYDARVLEQLQVVTALRGAGFGLDQVRAVLGVKRPGTSSRQRLAELSSVLDDLDAALREKEAAIAVARNLLDAWRAEIASVDDPSDSLLQC